MLTMPDHARLITFNTEATTKRCSAEVTQAFPYTTRMSHGARDHPRIIQYSTRICLDVPGQTSAHEPHFIRVDIGQTIQ